jgi:hypothetical protein
MAMAPSYGCHHSVPPPLLLMPLLLPVGELLLLLLLLLRLCADHPSLRWLPGCWMAADDHGRHQQPDAAQVMRQHELAHCRWWVHALLVLQQGGQQHGCCC